MTSRSRNDINGLSGSNSSTSSGSSSSSGNVFGRAFNKIAQKVVNVQQSISSTAQKAAERFLEEVTREELQVFGCLWETSETVERCRVCYVVFETVLANEKHHCRACGSVVCASCSTVVREEQLTSFMTQVLIPPTLCTDVVVATTDDRGNPSSSSNSSNNLLSRVTGGRQWRLCQPCLHGTVPSIAMREALRLQLDKQNQTNLSTTNSNKRKLATAVDQMGTKLVAKVNEVVGVKDDWQVAQGAENLPLFRGSFFPDTISNDATSSEAFVPPRAPYSTLHPGTPIGYAPPAAVVAAHAAPQVTRLTAIPPAPRYGYLEIVNKSMSSSPYAIKVLYLPPHPFALSSADDSGAGVTLTPESLPSLLAFWQSNVLFETAKPTFHVLAPGQRCYSFVNAQPNTAAVVAVVVLHDFDPATHDTLPSPAPPTDDTNRYRALARERESHMEHPVYGFHRARVFYFDVRQHHLLLKLRDPALLLPRQGTAVGRVGVLGYLQGRRVNTAMASSVDYAENVASNLRVFDLL